MLKRVHKLINNLQIGNNRFDKRRIASLLILDFIDNVFSKFNAPFMLFMVVMLSRGRSKMPISVKNYPTSVFYLIPDSNHQIIYNFCLITYKTGKILSLNRKKVFRFIFITYLCTLSCFCIGIFFGFDFLSFNFLRFNFFKFNVSNVYSLRYFSINEGFICIH